MGNLIIGAILIVIVALGISSSVKHFKGEGGMLRRQLNNKS